MTDINERMVALLRKMSAEFQPSKSGIGNPESLVYTELANYHEARAIVAELDGYSPSKEALAYIKFQGVPTGPVWNNYPEWSNEACAKAYDDGIAKGRELAELDRRTEKAVAPNRLFATGGYVKPIEGTRIQNTEPVRDITDKWDEIGLGDVPVDEPELKRLFEKRLTCDHDWCPVTKFGKDAPYSYLCANCGATM